MMWFLAPALLAGLTAIAIPVIVHLVQRERKRVVEFPSLMFLRKIPYRSVRRRAIRHWPLLLLRCLAFALIVLAFARPLLPGARLQAGAAGGGREVVILIDRSYSMGYGDHWDRARAEARRAVEALGPDDRATVVFFATDVEIGLRSTPERGGLIAPIDQATLGSGATRYGPALRAAAGLLESSRLPRREVIVISDFQKTGWDRAQDVKLPAGVTVTPVPVTETELANAAVVGAAIEREASAGRERVTVSARIVNRGAARIADREVALEVDGRRLDARRVSVEPRAPASVTFAPFTLASGRARVTVRLAPAALARDDVFHAVVTSGGRVPVLVLESSNPAPDSSLYLARALAVGGAPGFQAHVLPVDRVTPADLAAAAVIVLNDTRPPSGAAGRALEASIRGGTGLFVALGDRSAWPEDAPDLLPGVLGAPADRSGTRGGTLGFIDYSHPVFEIFNTPRSGDLTAARVFRYRQLAASGGVLARFDDGAVALAERRVEQGAVLAWTSTVDSYWNDLALKPVFVPFVHQAMKHLARYAEPRPWYTVGELFDPAASVAPGAAAAAIRAGDLVALTPGGKRETLAPGEGGRAFTLVEQGFYEIRSPGARAREPVVVAVNVDAAESDLAPLDPAELVSAVAGRAETPGPAEARGLTVEEQERRQALWWYLLAGGLLLLVAEIVVANRLPRIA
jgi:hypothetical protein